MTAIYKRELKSFFNSMIGYVFIAFFIAYTGIYFMAYNLNYGYPYFSYVLSGISFMYMIAVPVLTMRSFAEEQKNKTDQLLLTSPISLTKIVMGKYLAMTTILAIPCVIFLIFPLIIKAQGTAYILVDYLAILMFFLLGCVFISIGMYISSLTQSQIIAAIGTFGILMVINLWSGILEFVPTTASVNTVGIVVILSVFVFFVWKMTMNIVLAAVLEVAAVAGNIILYILKSEMYEGLISEKLGTLDLIGRFANIVSNNLFDVSGVILYLSLTGLFIFLTIQMIQKRRWS